MAKKQPKAGVSGEYSVVSIDTIQGNPRNPNKQNNFIFSKLVASISEYGLNDPIIVRRIADEGVMYEVIGGHHRLKAAQKLGMTSVPIVDLGEMSDVKADRLMIVLNETKGAPDADALAQLVQQIRDTGGEDALDVLPFTDAQFEELLDTSEEPVVEEDDEDETLSSGEPKDRKLRPSDVVVVLEMEGATQDEIKKVLTSLRKWRATRSDDAPTWYHLLQLLKADRKEKKGVLAQDGES